jgi:hypothetical protein
VFHRRDDPDAGAASASDCSDGSLGGEQFLWSEVDHEITWPGQAQDYARFMQGARQTAERCFQCEHETNAFTCPAADS